MKRKELVKELSNKKKLSSEDVFTLYDSLSLSERRRVKDDFEDELEDDIRERVEEEFDYNNVCVSDLNSFEAERLYGELQRYYEPESVFLAKNLYDEDKVQLLKKAFEIYNLKELIENLNITQAEAM